MSIELLKMIEDVDHTSKTEMFALNEEVYEWLLKNNPETVYAQFVSSRDALKAIRPEGYSLIMSVTFCTDFMKRANLSRSLKIKASLQHHIKDSFYSKELPTEELAELHAIIQALDYERQNNG